MAGSFATDAVLVEMLFADCCNMLDSCWVKFCKRSRPTSNADVLTARYEAQLQATMMRASSVPISSGRRYLNEMFERDHLRNSPGSMRHLSHSLFTVRRMISKQICRTAGQPKWESCIGRCSRECDVLSGRKPVVGKHRITLNGGQVNCWSRISLAARIPVARAPCTVP